LVQECTLKAQVHVLIAVVLESRLTKPTSAKTAMVKKLLRKRRFLKQKLIRDPLTVKNTSSMVSPMNTPIKRQEMLSLLSTSNPINYLREKELIYSLRKKSLSSNLLRVVILLLSSSTVLHSESKANQAK
jgi:hypothetical protein